jgi:hypothetical protein
MASRLTACIAATLVAAMPLSAQVIGLPVVNNGIPIGVVVSGDVGFTNDAFGKGRTYGAQVGAGIGLLGLTAGAASYSPDADGAEDVTSYGGAATLRLFGGPLVPFRITLQGGAARYEIESTSVTRIPVGVGFAATIPNPAFAIRPWVAPRYDFTRVAGETSSDFAVSGGIELGFLNGLTVRASYDRTFADSDLRPSILSFGLGYAIGR